ncbi:hypothetical protein MNV49_004984 [Pseudohyphozyma bogoriensis]|nr:hypothetical protein MNV49_004984 [Pseudohyphozyma bogoriensis]
MVHVTPPAPTPLSIRELLSLAISLRPQLPTLFTWADLKQYIHNGDLGALRRHPVLEDVYINRFNKLVKEEYGSTEAFLRVQLGWREGEGGVVAEERYWTREDEFNLRRNDWCYSIPLEIVDVAKLGLTGFTGQPPPPAPQLSGHGGGTEGPGREIEAFVLRTWKESEWETAWFCNPPHLQSVKGLAHFHVLARPKVEGAVPPVVENPIVQDA